MSLKIDNEVKVATSNKNQDKCKRKCISCMTMNPKYVISYKNFYRQLWDTLVLLFAIYNSIMIPIEISFFEEPWIPKLVEFNLVVDFVFIVDIIIMFFTSYLDIYSGKEVRDSIKIAKAYTSSRRFFTDFCSLLSLNENLQLFGFLKMLRVFRLGSIIKRSTAEPTVKQIAELLKISFYLILWLHVSGCFLWYVIKINKDQTDDEGTPLMWYPPLNWLNFEDSKIFDPDVGFLYRYSMSLYYSVLILGSNELGPVNIIEMLYICFMLVLNLFISLFLLSDLIGVITDFSKDDNEYQVQLDEMNAVMDAIKLVEDDKD